MRMWFCMLLWVGVASAQEVDVAGLRAGGAAAEATAQALLERDLSDAAVWEAVRDLRPGWEQPTHGIERGGSMWFGDRPPQEEALDGRVERKDHRWTLVETHVALQVGSSHLHDVVLLREAEAVWVREIDGARSLRELAERLGLDAEGRAGLLRALIQLQLSSRLGWDLERGYGSPVWSLSEGVTPQFLEDMVVVRVFIGE